MHKASDLQMSGARTSVGAITCLQKRPQCASLKSALFLLSIDGNPTGGVLVPCNGGVRKSSHFELPHLLLRGFPDSGLDYLLLRVSELRS